MKRLLAALAAGAIFGAGLALSMPRLIMPSIQVNMRAGHMPAPEDNGIRYLKIPVNAV